MIFSAPTVFSRATADVVFIVILVKFFLQVIWVIAFGLTNGFFGCTFCHEVYNIVLNSCSANNGTSPFCLLFRPVLCCFITWSAGQSALCRVSFALGVGWPCYALVAGIISKVIIEYHQVIVGSSSVQRRHVLCLLISITWFFRWLLHCDAVHVWEACIFREAESYVEPGNS